MTKKQLEKYQKEFDEFVANVEKMGGRFLTEDELRYKINGGTDDFASDQTEATADGAGETQASNENEDSSGKSEEAAEEDDDKSFWESVCEAVGGVVDAVGEAVSGLVDTVTDAVSDAAHAVGEVIEDVIDFFTGGSEDKTEQDTPASDGAVAAEAQNKSAEDAGKDNPENKTSSGSSKYGSNSTDSCEKTDKGRVDIICNGTRVVESVKNLSELLNSVPLDKDILDAEKASEIITKPTEIGLVYDCNNVSLSACAGLSFSKEENAFTASMHSAPSLYSNSLFNLESVTVSATIRF